MRKLISALFVAIVAAAPAISATYLYNFHKYFDPSTPNSVVEIKPTADGGYVIVGNMQLQYLNPPLGRPMVMKLAPNFALQWTTSYMVPGEITNPTLTTISAEDIYQTSDGGYIVCGHHIEEFSSNDAAFLLRLDPSGNVVWYNIYPGIYDLNSVVEVGTLVGNGGFMACGVSYVNFNSTATILKTDAAGVQQWTKYVYGNMGTGVLTPSYYKQIINYMMGPTGDLVALVGNANNYISGCNAVHSDVLVTICDTFGNVFMNNIYGQGDIGLFPDDMSTNEVGNSIAWDQSTDKLTIAGESSSYWLSQCGHSAGYDDTFAFQVDFGGSVLWVNRYPTPYAAGGKKIVVNPASPNAVWVSGQANTNLLGSSYTTDMSLMQLVHSNGLAVGCEVFGGNNADSSPSLCLNSVPNVVVLGNSYSVKTTQNVPYLVERYASKLKRCRDKGVAVSTIPEPLPIQPPIEQPVIVPEMPLPLVDVNVQLLEQTLCPKIEAIISPGGGVGHSGGFGTKSGSP